MKKTILYLLVLFVLGLGVWYFIFRDKDMFGVNEAGFKVPDTAAISRIFMADKKGNSILLERQADNTWQVNNTYPVIPQVIKLLLETMATQDAAFPVPETMHNTVITILAGQSVKVELYTKEGKKLRVFYVGGQAGDNKGAYMLMEGAKRPYVVQIPAFEGYVTPRYSTALADWRDRAVFSVPQKDLRSVHVQYVDEPLNSFTLSRNDNGAVHISGDSIIIKGKTINERRAGVYTSFFERVWCEGYINGVSGLDSIIRSTHKYCIVDVADIKGKAQHLEVYWMPINRRSKNMLSPAPGIPEQYDADRFYGTMNDFKDTVVLQRDIFNKIFRKAYEFYQPDDTSMSQLPVQGNAGSFKRKGS